MSAHDVAADYLRRGWAPVPVPHQQKRITVPGWQSLQLTEADLPAHFNGRPQNVGVLLGTRSGGLIDVDLDSNEAVALAEHFLPATESVFGRRLRPRSHYLFYADPLVDTRRYQDVDGASLVELRSDGAQTVFPGSEHSGEAIEWAVDGEPAQVSGEELAAAVARLAACVLVARHWPVPGSRHAASLALAGFLLRAGWDVESVEHFLQRAAWAASDEEWERRGANVQTTAGRLAKGHDTIGGPRLAGLLGEAVVARLSQWLALKVARATADIGDILAPLDALAPAPSIENVEAVLREVAIRAARAKADELRRRVIRQGAVERLEARQVPSPTGLVDAALRIRDDRADEDGRGQSILLADPEPWPDAVDGAKLLATLETTLRRFVALPESARRAVALWIVYAHAHDASDVSPLLAVTSPVMRCGKTTLFRVVTMLVPRVLATANITPAAIFRAVDKFRPTLLIDEADTFLRQSDEMRGLLNAGWTRQTAEVVRVVGDEHEPRTFSTWCAKAIAMIGKLPPTLHDRAVVVQMKRRTRGEQTERLREAKLRPLKGLCQQSARWAKDNFAALRAADPKVPEALDDRAADNWRPLLAVADRVGGEWPKWARQAAQRLSGAEQRAEDVLGVQLLADIRGTFEERITKGGAGADRLPSAQLTDALAAMGDRPWAEYGRRGKPLTQRQLARLLEPFGIAPKTLRLTVSGRETSLKGYEHDQFRDALARYLPSDPLHPLHVNSGADLGAKNDPLQGGSVTDREAALSVEEQRPVTPVTDRHALSRVARRVAGCLAAGTASPADEETCPACGASIVFGEFRNHARAHRDEEQA